MNMMDLIALITRKRQANVWPGGIEQKDKDGEVIFSVGDEVQESVKIDELISVALKHHQEGRRQVVFSQFKTALAELERRLTVAGLRVARLDGDTPRDLRGTIKSDFYRGHGDAEYRYDILLANYKTGGTGLNLTAATVIHILDEEWNPGRRDQAYRRTDRIGQVEEQDVYIYRIPASIDTWMSNIIHRKEKLVNEFAGTMRGDTVDDMVDSLREQMLSGELI
jgi:SNF2 family DNA or RNA helicase